MEFFKNKITIVLFIFSGVLITSCCNGPRAPETYMLDEALLEYALFLDSTQWIYQDSVSGSRDTVTVTDSKRRLVELSHGAAAPKKRCEVASYNEGFSYNMNYSLSKKKILVSSSSRCGYHAPENSFCYIVSTTDESNSESLPYYLFWQPIIGNTEGNSTLTNKYSTISFNGRTFTNVIEMTDKFYNVYYDPTIVTKTERRYFAKNIGLIRTEIDNDSLQVWNLVEETIIQ